MRVLERIEYLLDHFSEKLNLSEEAWLGDMLCLTSWTENQEKELNRIGEKFCLPKVENYEN